MPDHNVDQQHQLLRCATCNQSMAHVLQGTRILLLFSCYQHTQVPTACLDDALNRQAYAPVEASGFVDRVLNIMCCLTCSDSYVAALNQTATRFQN
jgi:hypothetical protein